MFVYFKDCSPNRADRENLARVGGLNQKQIDFLNHHVEILIKIEDYELVEARDEVWEKWANTPELERIGEVA